MHVGERRDYSQNDRSEGRLSFVPTCASVRDLPSVCLPEYHASVHALRANTRRKALTTVWLGGASRWTRSTRSTRSMCSLLEAVEVEWVFGIVDVVAARC